MCDERLWAAQRGEVKEVGMNHDSRPLRYRQRVGWDDARLEGGVNRRKSLPNRCEYQLNNYHKAAVDNLLLTFRVNCQRGRLRLIDS